MPAPCYHLRNLVDPAGQHTSCPPGWRIARVPLPPTPVTRPVLTAHGTPGLSLAVERPGIGNAISRSDTGHDARPRCRCCWSSRSPTVLTSRLLALAFSMLRGGLGGRARRMTVRWGAARSHARQSPELCATRRVRRAAGMTVRSSRGRGSSALPMLSATPVSRASCRRRSSAPGFARRARPRRDAAESPVRRLWVEERALFVERTQYVARGASPSSRARHLLCWHRAVVRSSRGQLSRLRGVSSRRSDLASGD